MENDATQPKRSDVIPPDVDLTQPPDDYDPYIEDDSGGGPGCLVWGLMGVFGIVLAIAIVLTAALAGFNSGLQTARVTAAAATSQNIARQCEILPEDIAASRFQLIEQRFASLTVDGVLAECAQVFVQQATIVYEQSLITPTAVVTAEPTVAATELVAATEAPEATASVTSDSPYDLNALLVEARGYMNSADYDEAVRTLDAIRAVDPTFESAVVNNLLFTALIESAKVEFRTEGGSLAEGILLTNRAQQFGDISLNDISFERSVAELYLDAQANLNLNYQLAISLLGQVIALSPNYPRGTGAAANQLLGQYEAYGDALLAGGDACLAETQFNNALARSPNNVQLQTKAQTANQQCIAGVPPTADPNATLDPNATPQAAVTPTSGVAPVGQQN